MKLATARAGVGFFGTILFIMFFMPSGLKDKSLAEQIVILVFSGFVVAGAAYFWTMYEDVKSERDREERRTLGGDSESSNRS